MKITAELISGKDFQFGTESPLLQYSMEETIRVKLGLRPQDEVIIILKEK
jgi:hypothetical protein